MSRKSKTRTQNKSRVTSKAPSNSESKTAPAQVVPSKNGPASEDLILNDRTELIKNAVGSYSARLPLGLKKVLFWILAIGSVFGIKSVSDVSVVQSMILNVQTADDRQKAAVATKSGKYEESEGLLTRCAEAYKNFHSDNIELAGILQDLAHVQMHLGRRTEAIANYKRSYVMTCRTLGKESAQALFTLSELAVANLDEHNTKQAIQQLQQVISDGQTSLPPDGRTMVSAKCMLAGAYVEVGNLVAAQDIYVPLLVTVSQHQSHDPLSALTEAQVHLGYGDCLLKMHDVDAAMHHFQIAVTIFAKERGLSDPLTLQALVGLADAMKHSKDKRINAASVQILGASCSELLRIQPSNLEAKRLSLNLALINLNAGKTVEAESICRNAMHFVDDKQYELIAQSKIVLGDIRIIEKRYGEAIKLLIQAIACLDSANIFLDPTRMEALFQLSVAEELNGDRTSAIEHCRSARDLSVNVQGPKDPSTEKYEHRLAELLSQD